MADIDPGYGGYAGTNRLLATAGNSPQALGQTIDNARGAIGLTQQQFELGKQRLGALNDIVSSVMADPTQDNATARITDGIRQGVIRPDDGARELQQITALGGDPNKIRQYAFQHGQQIATLQQRMESAYGNPSLVGTGNALTPVLTRTGPQGGVTAAGGAPNAPIPMQPTPEFQQSPASIQKPDGTTIQTNIAGRNAAIAGQGGGIAGPSPMLEGGIKTYQQDLADSSSKMQGVQPLLNALPLIQQLGPTGSGPTSEAFNKAKSTLITLGVIGPDTKDVDAFQEAKKYLNQYVSRSALAGRSDMGQLQQQVSSPNLETSNKATIELTKNAIAADRMAAATPLAYKSNDLSGYGQHKASYTQQQDLRAYKIDLMDPKDRYALLQDMLKKKDTAEGKKFFQSLQNAHDAKVLTPVNSGVPAVQ
jgi:hypothetical protein